MNTILLTGATGSLGSELLTRLLAKGHRVICLVRAESSAKAAARIARITGPHPEVRTIRGDITEPRCGISDIDRERLIGKVDRIVHCAASISFTDKKATHAANVNGTMHMLELADILDVWHIVHVSTAYVAGEAPAFNEDDMPSPIMFRPRNNYEETKQIGETMVRAWARNRSDRRYTILRPSILIGREDGSSPTFDAYFGYFMPIDGVARALRKRHEDGKELPSDVRIDRGNIEVPLVLRASQTATLNLVQIDWTADMMVALIGARLENRVYHLVNPRPPLVRWVIDTSLAHLQVRGVRVVETIEQKQQLIGGQSQLVARLQRQIDKILSQYDPYISHGTEFSMKRPLEDLKEGYRPPQPLDAGLLGRMLDFARASDWGHGTAPQHTVPA
jgi:nucleoside-diphosphate-sugar epimerase